MKALLVVLVSLITMGWAFPSFAAPTLSERDWQKLKLWSRSYGVSAFPDNPMTGQLVVITDDSASNACDSNAGAAISLCAWDGDSWISVGGGTGVTTLDEAYDGGKEVNGANSVANAVRIGDGVTPLCLYTDATLGPLIRPCTDANTRTYIWTNFTWCLYDVEGTSCILTVDPDAASTNAMYQFASAYRPTKTIWFGAASLSTDGTQCATPAEVTINSGPKMFTIICTENDSGRMHGQIQMPDSWDGGTITLTPYYIQTAADTGSVAVEGAAACRGMGETMNSTFGTEVNITDAAVTGSNAIDSATSSAITPNGTCAAGDFLYFYIDIDATANPTTAAATLHFVGVKLEYTVTSLSD